MTKKRSSYKLFFPPIPELLHGYNERKNLSTQYKYISSILHTLHTGSEKIWRENGEKQALKIFHTMAKHVPAYKDFLKKNNISPSKIKKFSDFLQVPITNKENYLQHYPIRALCWKGKFVEENWMISLPPLRSRSFFTRGKAVIWAPLRSESATTSTSSSTAVWATCSGVGSSPV